jgi:hypothetical protein
MRSTRKKVFGNKKKKVQLQAKREQKRLLKEKEEGTAQAHVVTDEHRIARKKEQKPKEENAVDDRNKYAPPSIACNSSCPLRGTF